MTTQVLANTWSEVDAVTAGYKDVPYLSGYFDTAFSQSITAGTPKYPESVAVSQDADSNNMVNLFEFAYVDVGSQTNIPVPKYIGTIARKFLITFSGSVSSTSSGVEIYLSGAINGTEITSSKIKAKITTASDIDVCGGSMICTLNENDYVLIGIDVGSGTSTVNIPNAIFTFSVAK